MKSDLTRMPAQESQHHRRPSVTLFSQAQDQEQAATYIVIGAPRGGTTMVAMLLKLLGIYLGDNLPANLESSLYNYDVLSRQGLSPKEIEESIRNSIRSANYDRMIWGWKYPRASLYLDGVWDSLVNPKLICMMRDPLAVSLRNIYRRGLDPLASLHNAMRQQQRNLDLIGRRKVPTLLCSYEKSIAAPLDLVEALHEFLGLSLEHADLLNEYAKKVNPKLGYRAANP